MKQEEKTKLTRNKILNSAIKEYGTKTYENASINSICNNNNISKGLIYHNFKDKDELYLCCVRNCFDEFTEFLSESKYDSNDFNASMKKLFDLRYQFFCENPYYSNIFFNTILQPPKHLVEQIKKIRKDFDEFNIKQFRNALKNITLRNGITEDEAVEYFFVFQKIYNEFFKDKVENINFNTLIEEHEIKLPKILDVLLYGIAKEIKE